MITGEDLTAFASEHGLIIPWKDVDEWADMINSNDGKCICNENRTCPCEESLDDVKRENPENQICACFLFSSQAYSDKWKAGEKDKDTKKQPKQTHEKKIEAVFVDEKYVPETPEIKTDIDALKSARELIERDQFNDANEVLMEAANKPGGCGICAGYLLAEAKRVELVEAVCSCGESQFDVKRCKEEKQKAKNAQNGMINLFIEVDKVSTPEASGVDELMEEKGNDVATVDGNGERKFRDEYHRCLSEKAQSTLLKDLTPQGKLCVAMKQCSKHQMTEDDAIESCDAAKELWKR